MRVQDCEGRKLLPELFPSWFWEKSRLKENRREKPLLDWMWAGSRTCSARGVYCWLSLPPCITNLETGRHVSAITFHPLEINLEQIFPQVCDWEQPAEGTAIKRKQQEGRGLEATQVLDTLLLVTNFLIFFQASLDLTLVVSKNQSGE